MKTHTPGPWLAIPTTAISRNTDSLRMDIVTTTGEWNPAFIAGDILPEDARLIASAPDLLSALERLAHPMADDDDLDFARAIIRKAKGQQP
jgi:hypothetical protein